MSAKSLDVFSLRDAVVGQYKNFATSFTTIRAEANRPAEIPHQAMLVGREKGFRVVTMLPLGSGHLSRLLNGRTLTSRAMAVAPVSVKRSR